ncbi:MAG: phosphatase PAP2 family protein [Eubacteriales bacterium]|nr:phosphatase PAP2 family protein [Eubacteriales bacterium]
MKNLLKKYGHIWVMGYVLLYLPWFFHLEANTPAQYTVMHAALDDKIPFNEYFIIPYLFWFVYVAGAVLYFFFTNKTDYYRLCGFLFVGMTISMIIFMIFPNGTDLRVSVNPDKNVFCRLVDIIHAADTPTNVFPSIHVYNSLGVHFAVMNSRSLRDRRGVRWFSLAAMVLICMSTVFLKQHSVLDVLGGVVLAYVMYPVVYMVDYVSSRKTAEEKVAG